MSSKNALLGVDILLRGLAEVHRVEKKYSQAVAFYSETAQICGDLGDGNGRADAFLRLGDVHRDQHHLSDAIRLYEQAAEIFERIGNTAKEATASSRAADIRRKLDPVNAK